MNAIELKQRRVAAGIPGRLVCAHAKIERSKLSDIERGYVQPSERDLLRIDEALSTLIVAKARVAQVAAEVGWPVGAL